ncbi:MAG TPA: hypothetical protein VFX60_18920 [Micromonospora sp.]|nr:hypothetical protein [Micromonospora sp.]
MDEQRLDPPGRMCPSTPVSNSTVFLGMITPAGRVAYVTPAVPTENVLDTLSADEAGRPLEKGYRFAGPCVTSSCGYWTGDHCGLGAKVAASYREVTDPADDALPKCAIRRDCRWFAEQGRAACTPCSYIATDAR